VSKSNSMKGKIGLQSGKVLDNSLDKQPSVDNICIPEREPIRQFDSRRDTELASPSTDAPSPRKIAGAAATLSRESSVIIKSRSGTVLQRQNSRQGGAQKLNSTMVGAGSTAERSTNVMNTSVTVTDRTGSPTSPLLHHSTKSTARANGERGSVGFSIVDRTLDSYNSKHKTGTSQPSVEDLSTSRHRDMFRSTATSQNKKPSETSWKRHLQDSQVNGKVKLSLLRRDSQRQEEKSEAEIGILIDTAANNKGVGYQPKNNLGYKGDEASTDRAQVASNPAKPEETRPGYFARGPFRNASSTNSNVFKSRDKSPESPLVSKPAANPDPKSKRFLEGKSSSLTRGDSTVKSSDKPPQTYYLGKLESRGSTSRQGGQRFMKSPSLVETPSAATGLDSPKFKVSSSKYRNDLSSTQKESNEIRLIKNNSLIENRSSGVVPTGVAGFRSTIGPGSHWLSNSSQQQEESTSHAKEQPGHSNGRSVDSKPSKEIETSKMRSTMNHSFLNKFNLENVIKKLKAEETVQQNEGQLTSTQVSANQSIGHNQQSNYLAVNTTSKQAFKRTNRGRGTKTNLLRSVFPNNNNTTATNN
jgi:hypothetical protein